MGTIVCYSLGVANIIFDFDGTMADTFHLFVTIFASLMHRPVPPREEIARMQGMTPFRFGVTLRIPPWKIPYLVAVGRRRMRGEMIDVEPFDGIPAVVSALHAAGHELYIMSSNSAQNIHTFLQKYNMDTQFTQVYGSVSLFGKAKVLRRAFTENNLRREDTFYIGDEVRDINAAKRVGIPIISVTWGYNNATIIEKHRPEFVVDNPIDIARVIADNTAPELME